SRLSLLLIGGNLLFGKNGLLVVVFYFRNKAKVNLQPVKIGLHHFHIVAVFLEYRPHFFSAFTGLVYDAHLACEHREAAFPVFNSRGIVSRKKQVGILLLNPEESGVHRLLHYRQYLSAGTGRLVGEFEYLFGIALM